MNSFEHIEQIDITELIEHIDITKNLLNLLSILSNMKLGSTVSNEGLSRLLKPAPFCFLLSYIFLSLLLAGDVESNPGPVYIDKVIKASYHQG